MSRLTKLYPYRPHRKDEKWVTDTEEGPIDITINYELSKPEKIRKTYPGMVKTGYPSCLLCKENEGLQEIFSSGKAEPKLIPIKLGAEQS